MEPSSILNMIKEYLEFHGLTTSAECLGSELASKKLQQKIDAPDPEVEATSEAHRRAIKARIVDAFNDWRASEWAHLWGHYVPFRSRSEEAHRVTFLCRVHFALGPWRDAEGAEEERAAAMQALARWMGSEEARVHADDATLAGFYALPHARDVARHPAFQEAARPDWVSSLRGKLERVLDHALVQLQVPALARVVGQYEAAVGAVRKRVQVQEARESSTLGAAKAATAAMARLLSLLEHESPSEASLRTAKYSLAQAVAVVEAADANFQRTRTPAPDPSAKAPPAADGASAAEGVDRPQDGSADACKQLRSLVLEAALTVGKTGSPASAAPLSAPMQRRMAHAARQAVTGSVPGGASAAERLAAADALGILVSPTALSSLAMGVTDPAAQASLACLLSLLAAREEGRAYLAGAVRTLPRSGSGEDADAAASTPLAAVLQASWDWAQACLRRGYAARGPLRHSLALLHLLWRSRDPRVPRVLSASPAVVSAAQFACSAAAGSVRSKDMRRAAAIALGGGQGRDRALSLLLDDVAGVARCGDEGGEPRAGATEEAVATLALVAVQPLARGAGPLAYLARRWCVEEVAPHNAAVGDRVSLVGALCRLAVAVHVLGEVAAHGEVVNATPRLRPASSRDGEAKAPEQCSQTLRVCTAACVAACGAAVRLVEEEGEGKEKGDAGDAALPWAVQPAVGACVFAEEEPSGVEGSHQVVRMQRLDAFRRLLSAAGPASDMARDAVHTWMEGGETAAHSDAGGARDRKDYKHEADEERKAGDEHEEKGVDEGVDGSGSGPAAEEGGNAPREEEQGSREDAGEDDDEDAVGPGKEPARAGVGDDDNAALEGTGGAEGPEHEENEAWEREEEKGQDFEHGEENHWEGQERAGDEEGDEHGEQVSTRDADENAVRPEEAPARADYDDDSARQVEQGREHGEDEDDWDDEGHWEDREHGEGEEGWEDRGHGEGEEGWEDRGHGEGEEGWEEQEDQERREEEGHDEGQERVEDEENQGDEMNAADDHEEQGEDEIADGSGGGTAPENKGGEECNEQVSPRDGGEDAAGPEEAQARADGGDDEAAAPDAGRAEHDGDDEKQEWGEDDGVDGSGNGPPAGDGEGGGKGEQVSKDGGEDATGPEDAPARADDGGAAAPDDAGGANSEEQGSPDDGA